MSSRPAAVTAWATAWANSVAAHGAAGLGHLRQRRVVLDRHRLQAEPGGAAGQRRPWSRRWPSRPACWAGCGRCRRAAGRETSAWPSSLTSALQRRPGGGLVVEGRQLQAVARRRRTGLDQQAGEHRGAGPDREARAAQATASARTSRSTRNFTGWPSSAPACWLRPERLAAGVSILPRVSGSSTPGRGRTGCCDVEESDWKFSRSSRGGGFCGQPASSQVSAGEVVPSRGLCTERRANDTVPVLRGGVVRRRPRSVHRLSRDVHGIGPTNHIFHRCHS